MFGGTVGGTTLGCENRSRALGMTYVVSSNPAIGTIFTPMFIVLNGLVGDLSSGPCRC